MEQVSKEEEAVMRRRRADMIRRHVNAFSGTISIASQLAWIGVAEAEEQLAEALELPPTIARAS